MITPMRKLTDTTTHSFLERVIWAPTRWPMGVMAVSAPSAKRPMPTTSSTAPIKNASSTSLGTGAIEKQSTSTIPVMGATEATASRTFSPRTVRFCPNRRRQCAIFPSGNPITSIIKQHFFHDIIKNMAFSTESQRFLFS